MPKLFEKIKKYHEITLNKTTCGLRKVSENYNFEFHFFVLHSIYTTKKSPG